MEATQTPSPLSSQTCAICDSQAAQSTMPAINLGSFSHLGASFHELDFIYALHEEDTDAPYIIGQILSFNDDANQVPHIQIRQLGHYDLIGPQSSANLSRKKDEVCHMHI
jgi:hypothetical protein